MQKYTLYQEVLVLALDGLVVGTGTATGAEVLEVEFAGAETAGDGVEADFGAGTIAELSAGDGSKTSA